MLNLGETKRCPLCFEEFHSFGNSHCDECRRELYLLALECEVDE
jgi:hypothetical protein